MSKAGKPASLWGAFVSVLQRWGCFHMGLRNLSLVVEPAPWTFLNLHLGDSVMKQYLLMMVGLGVVPRVSLRCVADLELQCNRRVLNLPSSSLRLLRSWVTGLCPQERPESLLWFFLF